MTPPPRVDVVVIDDVVRFALHLWCRLGGHLLVGIGDQHADGVVRDKDGRPQRQWFRETVDGAPRRLLSASGEVGFWWVNAGSDRWLQELRQTFSLVKDTSRLIFVVDVYVERHRVATTAAPHTPYTASAAIDELNALVAESECMSAIEVVPVSSLASRELRPASSGAEQVKTSGTALSPSSAGPVREKTPATLDHIGKQIRAGAIHASGVDAEPEVEYHVLVTGAGFELPSSDTKDLVVFGVPPTYRLLMEMSGPFGSGQGDSFHVDLHEGGAGSLPGATPKLKGRRLARWGEISGGPSIPPDNSETLDEWWSQVLAWASLPDDRNGDAAPDRHAIHDRERGLREAFRRVFVRYDFGQIRHVLLAAKSPPEVWLTTNYTRFVDRAIASALRERPPRPPRAESEAADPGGAAAATGAQQRSWRTIDTAAAATYLQRDLGSGLEPERLSQRHRLLFKLHGDITHLRTMAMAGEDKEPYSRLTMAVDDLHLVYASAKEFLSRRFRNLRDAPAGGTGKPQRADEFRVVWHIIGHRLDDRTLVDLLTGVAKSTPDIPMTYVIVNPDPKHALEASEKIALPKNRYICEQTAEQYILGLRDEKGNVDWSRWRDVVGAAAAVPRAVPPAAQPDEAAAPDTANPPGRSPALGQP